MSNYEEYRHLRHAIRAMQASLDQLDIRSQQIQSSLLSFSIQLDRVIGRYVDEQ